MGFTQNQRKGLQTRAIEAASVLRVHVQEGEGGQRWIAFSHGPLALAQKVSSIPGAEPFEGRTPDQALAMLGQSTEDGSYSIADTEIALVPYHMAYTDSSGPRTYFKCA